MSVGSTMKEQKFNAWKGFAFVMALLVYVGGLLYAGVHNWSLLTSGVDSGMLIWAALGVITLEMSALALPLALHFWFYDAGQRLAGFGFYLLDAALIIFNVVLDFNAKAYGGLSNMPQWMQIYKFWGAPITPLVCAAGWSLMFLLDPAAKERAMIETLRASARAHMANRLAEAAKSAEINEAVDQAAIELATSVIDATLAEAVSNGGKHLPRGQTYIPAATSNGNGKLHEQAFFHLPKMRRRKAPRYRYNNEAHSGPLDLEDEDGHPFGG